MAMLHKRGTTIIEVLIGTVMVVALVLGTASLFGFVAQRVSADTAQSAVCTQANALADELTKFISQAKTCDLPVSGSITALRCQMPANGVDTDQDGLADSFSPTSYDYTTDTETFATGKYVWFYMSDTTGTWGSTGTTFWRASPPTSANPTSSDFNTNWAKYYGGNARWNFIDSVSFSIDVPNEKVTFTISASSLNRAERSASAEAGTSNNAKVSITRTVFWRSYR